MAVTSWPLTPLGRRLTPLFPSTSSSSPHLAARYPRATLAVLSTRLSQLGGPQGERQAEEVEEITDPEELRRIFQVI